MRDEPDAGGHVAPEPPASGVEGLQPLVLRGIAWKGIGQIGIQTTRLVVALALARILAPEEYGIAGMALVFGSFILIFSDLALGQAIVQRRSLTAEDKATAFWTSVGAGTAFTLVGIGLAGPVADFFDEPRLRPMIMVLSLNFLISSIGTTQSALLVREMAFRGLEIREIAAAAAGAVTAITVALAGFGAWAIITQQLAVSIVSTLLVWLYSSWRPTRRFSMERLRGLAGYTANVFGTNTVTQLRATTDNVLIGRFLGAPALGAYALAYNIILVPFNRIAVPVAQVLFPAMSRIQDDPGLVAVYWRRSMRMLGAFAMPALVGLTLVAPDFVPVVLGEKWTDAVPVIQLLALVGLLQTLQFLNPAVLQALDRTSLLFRWSLVSYAVAVIAFVIGLHWGIVGVAAAFLVAASITEPTFAWLTGRLVGVGVGTLARDLAGVAQATIAMAGAVLVTRLWLVDAGFGASARLAAGVPIGALVYLGVCYWRAPGVVEEARRLRPKGRSSAEA